MKAWDRSEEKYNSHHRSALARLAVSALLLGVIILGLGLELQSAVLVAQPLVLNYRTVSLVDSSTQTGASIITIEFDVTNISTVSYSNISVAAISITSGSSFGSVAVGNLAAGETRTVTGQLNIPTPSIGDITFRINHS